MPTSDEKESLFKTPQKRHTRQKTDKTLMTLIGRPLEEWFMGSMNAMNTYPTLQSLLDELKPSRVRRVLYTSCLGRWGSSMRIGITSMCNQTLFSKDMLTYEP